MNKKGYDFYSYLMKKGVNLVDFGRDGNCGYSAIVGGMARETRGEVGIWNYEDLRREIAKYIVSIQEKFQLLPPDFLDEQEGLQQLKRKVTKDWFDEGIAPFIPFITRHPLHIWTERRDLETGEVNGIVASKFSKGSKYEEEPITIVLMNEHYVLADFSMLRRVS